MSSHSENVPSADRLPRTNTVRRVGGNALSLLACDVVNRAATFVIYALVARYAGARAFGQLSLGLTIVYTLQVFATIGLPTLIVREVSKRSESAGRYFINSTTICLGTSLVSYALLGLFLFLSDYAAGTSRVILLVGLSTVPWALCWVTEAVFRAHERMHLIVVAALPVNLAKVAIAYYLLSRGRSIADVAGLIVASHVAIALIEWVLLWFLLRPVVAKVEWRFCRDLICDSWKFFGIDALIAVWVCIDVLLLSWFHDEAAVGAFAAATQLLLPARMALQAIVNSLFPLMCAQAEQDDGRARSLAALVCELLMVVTLPGCVLLWFGARPLIGLIYSHADFVDSVAALRIMVPTLLLYATTRVLGQLLMSYRREGRNLRIIVIDVLFNLGCGAVLTSQLGVIGAAATVLLTQTLDCWLHYLSTRALLDSDLRMSPTGGPALVRQALIAAVAMASVLRISGDMPFPVAAAVGLMVFAGLLTTLFCMACGGVGVLRKHIAILVLEK